MLQLEAALAVLDAIAALSGQILPSGGLPAIENIADLGFSVKWPNDIWYKGGKLAGILAESRSFQESMRIVLGVGINLAERNQVSNVNTHLSSLANYDLIPHSIVEIEVVLNAALSSIFERRENQRNVLDGAQMFTADGITNTGPGELVFASVALHVSKYGNPTLNSDEITLQGISPSGALEVVEQSGNHRSIDDTSALIWQPLSEG